MSTIEQIQKEAESLNQRYRKSEEAITAVENAIQKNQVALSENTTVKKELESLKEGQRVYKLVGPVLLRVDVEEAKSNVENRLKLIERQSQDLAEKAKQESENYKKIEDEMIQLQQKVAMFQVQNMPKQK